MIFRQKARCGFMIQDAFDFGGIRLHLVGGLVEFFYFPRNIGFLIIPIDFHIFPRGGLTTNQFMFGKISVFAQRNP